MISVRTAIAIFCLFSSVSVTASPQIRQVSEYPVLAAGQTNFTIPESDAELYIETLHLTANLSMKADPSIKAINWTVRKIVIDQGNATLDLSAPRARAATGSSGAAANPWQADYCQVGAKGNTGGRGTDGKSSIPMNIVGIRVIENHGSLWIRSDGQPGGTGGTGGQGQKGGGNKHVFIGGCGFASGGAGGDGGSPGNGGSVSIVNMSTEAAPRTNILHPVVESAHCWPDYDQQRPTGAQPSSGVIVAVGVPGCPGGKGQSGPVGDDGAPRPQ